MFFLPEGVMVDYLAVSEGQSLKSGDTILQLNIEELQDTLDSTKAQLGQQKSTVCQSHFYKHSGQQWGVLCTRSS